MSGRSRPSPRGGREVPGAGGVLLACALMLAALLAVSVWFGLAKAAQEEEGPPARVVMHDSLAPTYTSDGEVISWYVLVDPDTSVEYLVNDRGGCCARLDAHGSPMGVIAYE